MESGRGCGGGAAGAGGVSGATGGRQLLGVGGGGSREHCCEARYPTGQLVCVLEEDWSTCCSIRMGQGQRSYTYLLYGRRESLGLRLLMGDTDSLFLTACGY